MLLRADGTVEAQATTGGTLIGSLRTPSIATRTFSVAAGDTLILYSDGLPEARTGPGTDRYGEDALQAFLTRLTPTTAPVAIEALTRLLGTLERLDDDVALMGLSFGAAAPDS
jgi:sigma-B regulation protein RsbU (phosphoserine phosphatase)